MSERIVSPFGASSTAREVVAGRDLGGVNAVVTGAASGIGAETARALAEAGAHVTLAVRDEAAGQTVAGQMNAALDVPRVTVGRLDLAQMASVRAFADAWGKAPLHLLINNAGVMACPLTYTADDLEMQIGTNHFGHFLLAALLAPALCKGAQERGGGSRVVALSSIGHRRSDIHFEDLHYRSRPYDKWDAYGQSKTANALFAVGFHARLKGEGITANAVMPGGIMTPLQRHLPREEMIAMGWMTEEGVVSDRFKTTAQGAATSVWAAVGPELAGVGGLYLEDCAQAAPWSAEQPYTGVMPYALDPEAAERLWTVTAAATGATA